MSTCSEKIFRWNCPRIGCQFQKFDHCWGTSEHSPGCHARLPEVAWVFAKTVAVNSVIIVDSPTFASRIFRD